MTTARPAREGAAAVMMSDLPASLVYAVILLLVFSIVLAWHIRSLERRVERLERDRGPDDSDAGRGR